MTKMENAFPQKWTEKWNKHLEQGGTKWNKVDYEIPFKRSLSVEYVWTCFEHFYHIFDAILFQCLSWLLHRVHEYLMSYFNAIMLSSIGATKYCLLIAIKCAFCCNTRAWSRAIPRNNWNKNTTFLLSVRWDNITGWLWS